MALNVAGYEVVSMVGTVLLAGAWWAYARRKARGDFPAFGVYLLCRLGVRLALGAILLAVRLSLIGKHPADVLYFYVFWTGYLAGAGTALLVIHEVFRHLMLTLPDLGRYGLIAFRWVTVTSAVLALAMGLYPVGSNRNILVSATSGLMRCMSVLEICLLAFILVSMQTLRLSARSREFGVALGLATIAAADLLGSAFEFQSSSSAATANLCCKIVVALVPAVWIMYFLRPQPERARFAMPAESPLGRWNEIAGALGKPAPHATATWVGDSFLQDVERAVDRVLEKNLTNPSQ